MPFRYTNIATASLADKGVCRDETQFQARFSDVEPPLYLVAHWFDDKRVNTT